MLALSVMMSVLLNEVQESPVIFISVISNLAIFNLVIYFVVIICITSGLLLSTLAFIGELFLGRKKD
mgnify:CR=1 FL=1